MKMHRNWLLLLGIFLMCIILYAITMLPQDRIYSEYKKAFKELPHPPGTEFIADYNAFGVLDKTRVMYKEDFARVVITGLGGFACTLAAERILRRFMPRKP